MIQTKNKIIVIIMAIISICSTTSAFAQQQQQQQQQNITTGICNQTICMGTNQTIIVHGNPLKLVCHEFDVRNDTMNFCMLELVPKQ